jgi:type III restriction enzyme
MAHRRPDLPKALLWLVPWSNLLAQTIQNLSLPQHPYRQKLDTLFSHRVEVLSKEDLLQGLDIQPQQISEQLTVMVMSFASLRAKNKDGRKVYQENSSLAAYGESASLIEIIQKMNPVVVVDESHNAESELSAEMLQAVNPSFILDLTATPKSNSNVIHFTPALELKKERMVKLPVIAYNLHSKSEVIDSAVQLRCRLESLSGEIRPIVLFQAESRTAEDKTTFEKVKEELVKAGIPQEQIKIKTAGIDELKGVDLKSKDCPVRYIITINALKEGWDCPFAYILASLADKSSAVDVEQILGRILRQPGAKLHPEPLLNMSYVFTASLKFKDTLDGIVKALQSNGFSERDYFEKDFASENAQEEQNTQNVQVAQEPQDLKLNLKVNELISYENNELENLRSIEQAAVSKYTEMEEQIQNPDFAEEAMQNEPGQIKAQAMRESFHDLALGIKLPQFMLRTPPSALFDSGSVPLNREVLLKGFDIRAQNSEIDFSAAIPEVYAVDIEGDTPQWIRMNDDAVFEIIVARPQEKQLQDIAWQLVNAMGNMSPFSEPELLVYTERALSALSIDTLHDVLRHKRNSAKILKLKINSLADAFAEKEFLDYLAVKKIFVEGVWKFPKNIHPPKLGSSIQKSLYARESEMNGFETHAISELASLPNVVFWHRNLERGKGFALNGFLNHYPDFILRTQSGNWIMVETKGDDRDNPDSAAKARLGKEWANLAGDQFQYFMLFDKTAPGYGYTLAKGKELVGKL